ncbi:MAG: response regulator [Planctomycetes bacterium]|nr:response regulator [Planctomycetota bacterium]
MADDVQPQPIEVLLVDDNEDDLILLTETLREARHLQIVQVAHSGAEALAYLKREAPFVGARPPGLILLDMQMPQPDGLEVLRVLKADPELRMIPVVILTASTRAEDVARSYAGGACSFVSKPVDLQQLKAVFAQFSLYWTQISIVPSCRESR